MARVILLIKANPVIHRRRILRDGLQTTNKFTKKYIPDKKLNQGNY